MTSSPSTLQVVTAALEVAGLIEVIHGSNDVEISGVTQDSRTVQPGNLFLAWRGSALDAHDFVAQAAEMGVAAAVVERYVPEAEIPQIQVSDGRLAAALAADVMLGSPWAELFTVGVTGTNGKTTTALLAQHLLGSRGAAAALGTLGLVEPNGSVREGTGGLTTPGPVAISTWLADLAEEGAKSVTVEASSHALDQRRLDGVRFDAVVFTNLSQDHLDYHTDMAAYFEAKSHLLNLMKTKGCAVINAADAHWKNLPVEGRNTVTYGIDESADLRAEMIEPGPSGTRFRMASPSGEVDVDLPLIGRFNIENCLAAAVVGTVAGMSLDAVADRLASVPQIPGRLEVVARRPFTVVIDFAHTPDALRGVLTMMRPLTSGRLIVVFGAGGDRDRGKRPEMARVVAQVADLVVITSDNPRTEDPES
ncbi:MAG: UDP-N-acetylmuramoyl-L-alanyl-D-glutamate--2,6-diaminopimelate ligase, partial [Gemmatimonadota bacterium]|nr:UDP-N-acetylmuramoyl-L-alanyl-D-glutamate--2,6-diaminopimelate ligase [Gemmatimonadota bacterium]